MATVWAPVHAFVTHRPHALQSEDSVIMDCKNIPSTCLGSAVARCPLTMSQQPSEKQGERLDCSFF